LEIPTEKTKTLVFQGKEPTTSKTCRDKFISLGYPMSCQGDVDISNKITKYTKTMGIINKEFKPFLLQRPA
jgi:hypothetical protein